MMIASALSRAKSAVAVKRFLNFFSIAFGDRLDVGLPFSSISIFAGSTSKPGPEALEREEADGEADVAQADHADDGLLVLISCSIEGDFLVGSP
jgi:hypothetical protein